MTPTLEVVRVWDRLEVGPVKLEPTRLTMPYRVVIGDVVHETELTFSYAAAAPTPADAVFDPESLVDQNLASLIGAQVALNYGLFARELVFFGPFDKHDRAFLRDMAENTAREIYVKKLLEPNPFLVGEARSLVPERRERYCAATLVFPNKIESIAGQAAWSAPDSKRVAVLSSGGKESLLSQGLLEELGLEVHALFGNESGRHWFTALNGFRHLERTRPGRTARVWMTSDRLFTWVKRQLPFIRPDFDRMRADDYPVRLWTVAVFLFGALPLMKKRGLGRLVIGDEFDTTRRVTTAGIPHYDGLFDQSRFFDEALTRYFQKKGWGLQQFSILRPVSELLVEKTLAERYPELFAQQVSCHAASVDKADERVRPCGKCEKCRRVVGMLSAFGLDPGTIGYGPNQIAECLRALVDEGAHQEAAATHHVLTLLADRGLVDRASLPPGVRPHPEVMKLRFTPTESPLNTLPSDLRAPLWSILLEHAEGALERQGRAWVALNPLTRQAPPYPFERASSPPSRDLSREVLLGELTWPQAEARFREVDVALLPVGATEQHGPHLTLDIDAWDAALLARQVAERCTEPRPLVLPAINYGVSYHHEEFAGTFSVSPDTLARMVHELGLAAARNGIRKLVIVNGHGGNVPALQFAAQMINRDANIFVCVDTGETSDAEVSGLIETPHDVHAGEYETSTSLYLRPERVYMELATPSAVRFDSRYLDFGSSVSVAWFSRTKRLSPSGVMGDPTKATREKGERIWKVMVDNLLELVEHLKSSSLDDIHRRRE